MILGRGSCRSPEALKTLNSYLIKLAGMPKDNAKFAEVYKLVVQKISRDRVREQRRNPRNPFPLKVFYACLDYLHEEAKSMENKKEMRLRKIQNATLFRGPQLKHMEERKTRINKLTKMSIRLER